MDLFQSWKNFDSGSGMDRIFVQNFALTICRTCKLYMGVKSRRGEKVGGGGVKSRTPHSPDI